VELADLVAISQLDRHEVESALLELLQFNLVDANRMTAGGQGSFRYSLHALTRQFMEAEVGQSW
jgi:hypothetical protein